MLNFRLWSALFCVISLRVVSDFDWIFSLTVFVLNLRLIVQKVLKIFAIIMEDWKLNARTVVKLHR